MNNIVWKMSTSFHQFDYCGLCKLSHKKRKKHIYSKRHQEIVTNILKKFRNKVLVCLSSLDNVEVYELGWEAGAKVWCYFCETDTDKHSVMEDCTVKHGGFLQHLCSVDHLAKMQEFFWKHLIDKKKKSDFIVKLEDFQKFTKSLDAAVQTFRQTLLIKRLQEAEKIRRQDYKQRLIATRRPTQTNAREQTNSVKRFKSNSSDAGNHGKSTLRAFGNGLAFVELDQVDNDEGNVFSDAVPPWLKDDVDVSKKDEIGPSMDEYQKELKRESKRKLPKDRVGALFDRNTKSELDWLPSFGRVWNKGRRLNSKNQFQRNMKRNHTSSTASNPFSDTPRQARYTTSKTDPPHSKISNTSLHQPEQNHWTPTGVMTNSSQIGANEMKPLSNSSVNTGIRSNSGVHSDIRFDSSVSTGIRFDSPACTGIRFDSPASTGIRFASPASTGIRFASPVSTGIRFESSVNTGMQFASSVHSGAEFQTNNFVSESTPSHFSSSTFIPYRKQRVKSEKKYSDSLSQLIVTPILQTNCDTR